MESVLVFLLVIGGVWAIYLVPPMLNSRRETPLASTAEYSRIAARLDHVQGERRSSIGLSRTAVLARRRRTLASLTIGAATSLALAVTASSLGWLLVHIVIDAVLAWYVAVLLQIKQTRAIQEPTPLVAATNEFVERPGARVIAS